MGGACLSPLCFDDPMPANYRPKGGLEGCAFLVTGGGTGIGAAAAEALVADGGTVTICGRTEEKLVAAADAYDRAPARPAEGAGEGGPGVGT